ncbi:MAG: ArsB/NhaD family transporter, partial [Candidatus Alkanophagales archaeon]
MGGLRDFRSLIAYFAGLLLTAIAVGGTGLSVSQMMSVTIFVAIILGAILFWRLRLAFALAGVAALLFSKVLDVPHLMRYAHFDVILFLMGMMTVIGFLEEQGFFEHVLEMLFRHFSRSGFVLVSGLLLMSAVFAALVDEVTSILFMTALTLRIAERYDLDPLPMVIATVMATNVGSSFTVVGNPIGVLIAFEGNLTFLDFIRWATPTGVAVLILTIALVLLYWRPYITTLDGMMNLLGKPDFEGVDGRKMRVSWAVFLCTIGGLVLHHPLEELLHLERNTLLLAVPLVMAGVAL